MRSLLLAFPVLGGLLIIQSTIVVRVSLLRGTADLLLLAVVAWGLQKRVQTAWQWGLIAGLMISLTSALPFGVALLGYPLAAGVAVVLRRRVWQAPMLAMFLATFLGTLLTHALAVIGLRLVGDALPILQVLNLITLPSLLLNLLLAIPAYAWLNDLANWLHPEELEI